MPPDLALPSPAALLAGTEPPVASDQDDLAVPSTPATAESGPISPASPSARSRAS